LSDAELEAVLAAMRADVQSEEVAVARRALSLFVRMVDAERLVIWYHSIFAQNWRGTKWSSSTLTTEVE
jgi:hypothetical protein